MINLVDVLKNKYRYIKYKQIKALLGVYKVQSKQLVRIGGDNDGAYIMLDDLRGGTAYSFGIADNVTWDEKLSVFGYRVYCYDHTIESFPSDNESLVWRKCGLSGTDNKKENMLSLNTIIRNDRPIGESVILKIDIEGGEWEALDTVPSETLMLFDQISIEFHGLANIRDKKRIKILKKLNRSHAAIWIHANNAAEVVNIKGMDIPALLEVTYVNRSKYNLVKTRFDSPTDLDRKNVPANEDIILKGWGTIK